MQQRTKRGAIVIEAIDYRLIRQLRSASAGPGMPGSGKPNFADQESSPLKKISPSPRIISDGEKGAQTNRAGVDSLNQGS